MEYTREKLQTSLMAVTDCCPIISEYCKIDNKTGYIQCIIPIHKNIDWLVHYELNKNYFVIHFEKDGYESLIQKLKAFIQNNEEFEEIQSPVGNRFGCKFLHSFCQTDINEITLTFKKLYELINPLVNVHLLTDLAKELYELKKKELNKLPHQINLIDELHANENAHTRILRTILQYKSNGEFTILKSFVELCINHLTQNKEFVLSKIKNPRITAEKERIDCLIEEYDHSYAIIVENKIKGADDQAAQLERYYKKIQAHGVPEEHIYIVYLTKDGGEPGDKSLTPWVKAKLKCQDTSHSRFVALNYRYDILPWLKENILFEIKVKEELLHSAIVQYIDHLEGMMGKRKREQPIYEIMNEKFEEKLNLNGPSTEKWLTLDSIQKQVDELKNVLINTKEKYAKSIFKEFEESIKPYFGAGVNNQITNASFFQIFIPQVSHKVHFEWCGLSLKKLCSGGHVKFVLHTEYTDANKAIELVVNDAFKNAVKQNGFTFCYEYEESPIRTIFTKDVYLKKGFNPSNDLSSIYKNAENLISFIQDTRIRKSNENLTEIRNFLLQNTSDIVIDEPWQGFDLCMVFNKGKSGEVGIESFYAINDNNELEYRIMISVWKKENWTDHLETKLKENLHFTLVDKETSEMRCWAHLEPINNPSVELIKARLLDVYRIVKEI